MIDFTEYWLKYYNIMARLDFILKRAKDEFDHICHMRVESARKIEHKNNLIIDINENLRAVDKSIIKFCIKYITNINNRNVKMSEYCKERLSYFNTHYIPEDDSIQGSIDFIQYAIKFRKVVFDCAAGYIEYASEYPSDIVYTGKLTNAGEVKNLPFSDDRKIAIKRSTDRKNFTKPVYEAFIRIPNKRPIKAKAKECKIDTLMYPYLKHYTMIDVIYKDDCYHYLISLLSMKNG